MFPRDEVILNGGATCNVSSVYNEKYICTNVLDGSSNAWITRYELAGGWIWIQLDQNYYISRVDLRGRCFMEKSPKIVVLRFSDASTQKVH